jgi:hypothetical protein
MDSVPHLDTANPFVVASEEQYALLAAAAKLNEPRVRELIALAADAEKAIVAGEPALAKIEALRFGLGALLPPANIRISTRLAALISQSGKKRA